MATIDHHRDASYVWPLAVLLSLLLHGLMLVLLRPLWLQAQSATDENDVLVPFQLITESPTDLVSPNADPNPDLTTSDAATAALQQEADQPSFTEFKAPVPSSAQIPAEVSRSAQATNPSSQSQAGGGARPAANSGAPPSAASDPIPATADGSRFPVPASRPQTTPGPTATTTPGPTATYESPIPAQVATPSAPIPTVPSAPIPNPDGSPPSSPSATARSQSNPAAPPISAQGGQLTVGDFDQDPLGRDFPDTPPRILNHQIGLLAPMTPVCIVTNLASLAATTPQTTLRLRMRVDTNGKISHTSVVQSSGNATVDDLVRCLVEHQLQLEPAKTADTPQMTDAYILPVEIQF